MTDSIEDVAETAITGTIAPWWPMVKMGLAILVVVAVIGGILYEGWHIYHAGQVTQALQDQPRIQKAAVKAVTATVVGKETTTVAEAGAKSAGKKAAIKSKTNAAIEQVMHAVPPDQDPIVSDALARAYVEQLSGLRDQGGSTGDVQSQNP